jgi:hypothetical protein
VSTVSWWTVDLRVLDGQDMYFSFGCKHVMDKICRKALDTSARWTEYVTNILHLMFLCVWKKNAFKQNAGDIDQYEELWKRKEGCRSCFCRRKQFVLFKQSFVRFKELKVWYPTYYHQTTSIMKMKSNTNINICIAKRCFYIATLNNDMFRLLYRPSSGCTFVYFKANYKIYNFCFCFCQRDFVHIYKICI